MVMVDTVPITILVPALRMTAPTRHRISRKGSAYESRVRISKKMANRTARTTMIMTSRLAESTRNLFWTNSPAMTVL